MRVLMLSKVIFDNKYQSHQSSDVDLEDDDLDLSNKVDRVSQNLVDFNLLNNDRFSGELDIFVQQDFQDDETYCSPNDK